MLPEGVTSVGGHGRIAFRLDAGELRRLDYELVCERWGAYRIGLLDVRVRSAFGLLSTRRRSTRGYPFAPIRGASGCGAS